MDVFSLQSEVYERTKVEEITLQDYLLACREDAGMRATAAERMIAAIGEPELVDTSQDQRLSRISLNRTIKRYPAFADLYGMEETIERIVGFFRHASQGLEERKQILYLLGPVGGGKSTVAEILKRLMEQEPIYVLKAGEQVSPVFESPLGLFNPERMGDLLEDKYNIPRRLLTGLISPGPSNGWTSSMATSRNSPSPRSTRRSCARSASPRPNRVTKTTRTSRRWSASSISQARTSEPERPRRLQLFGRPQPHDARAPGIRRDVQGSDQGAAPRF